MFRGIISESPFVGGAAEQLFQNIHGDSSYNGDVSFLSTLRALLSPRMQQDENLRLCFYKNGFTENDVATHPIGTIVRAMGNPRTQRNEPSICTICNVSIDGRIDVRACMEALKRGFCEAYEGWSMIGKVTDFYRKHFYVLCFVNPEIKSVCIFAENLNIKKLHYLQCSILAFFPWYFNPDDGVSDAEMSLISSFLENTSDRYTEAVKQIAEQHDFRTESIRRLLKDFDVKFESMMLNDTKEELRRIDSKISDLNSTIATCISEKAEKELLLLGIENKLSDRTNTSEIMEYFLCNKSLVLFDVYGDLLVFGVKTYLAYFDEELARSIIENKNSYAYEEASADGDGGISCDDMGALMKAVFLDQTLKVRICAAYQLGQRSGVHPFGHYQFGCEFNGYMPNPHIDKYECMGNYTAEINNLFKARNYIAMIEQCVASANSLNFGDSTVFRSFMHDLYCDHGTRMKCIELPDGAVVTPAEAIEWLHRQEGTANESN